MLAFRTPLATTRGQLWLLLGSVAIAMVLIAALWWQPVESHSRLTLPPRGGDFTLRSADGPVALADLRGRLVVLYFGYTLCPDVCPTALGFLAAALRSLSHEEQAQVQGLFISVDPERDTLDHLKTYSTFFHPSLIGVTGSAEELKQVADRYSATYRRVASDSGIGYLVDHTADLYLIDRRGQLRTIIPHGTTAAEIATDLRQLL
jgi:protein SCO1